MKALGVVKRTIGAVVDGNCSGRKRADVCSAFWEPLDLGGPYVRRPLIPGVKERADAKGIAPDEYEIGSDVDHGKDSVDFAARVGEPDLFNEVQQDAAVSVARFAEVVFVAEFDVVVYLAIAYDFAAAAVKIANERLVSAVADTVDCEAREPERHARVILDGAILGSPISEGVDAIWERFRVRTETAPNSAHPRGSCVFKVDPSKPHRLIIR